jgi:hypothetical protein
MAQDRIKCLDFINMMMNFLVYSQEKHFLEIRVIINCSVKLLYPSHCIIIIIIIIGIIIIIVDNAVAYN